MWIKELGFIRGVKGKAPEIWDYLHTTYKISKYTLNLYDFNREDRSYLIVKQDRITTLEPFLMSCMNGNYIMRNISEVFLEPRLTVYYRGCPGRGEEIIKALEESGGINNMGCTGGDPDSLYFIDYQCRINRTIDEADLGYLLKKNAKELFLPEIEYITLFGKEYKASEVMKKISTLTPRKQNG